MRFTTSTIYAITSVSQYLVNLNYLCLQFFINIFPNYLSYPGHGLSTSCGREPRENPTPNSTHVNKCSNTGFKLLTYSSWRLGHWIPQVPFQRSRKRALCIILPDLSYREALEITSILWLCMIQPIYIFDNNL